MIIDIPYFKQDTDYSCGAVTIQMILRHFGIIKSEEKLIIKLHTDDKYGTHHKPIIDYLTAQGLYCYVDTNSSLDALRHYIEKHNLPVMVHYVEPTDELDHYSLVIGFSENKVILHDPYNGPKFEISKEEFERRWHDAKREFPKWMLIASTEPIDTGKMYSPKK